MNKSNELKLAIALIALRHKPADQSCASYVLELQSRFPLRSTRASEVACDPWRTRVLALEKELRELQEKYECQSLDLAASRVTPVHGSQRSEPACPAPASTPVSTKKRSKKKAHAAPAPLNDKDVKRKSLEEIMREGPLLPQLSSRGELLSSFQTLDALVDTRPQTPSGIPVDICVLAATRALDALAATLSTCLPPHAPSAATPGILETLSTLLARLLLAVLPLLLPSGFRKTPNAIGTQDTRSHLNSLLGHLMTSVLHPLIASFHPSSLAHLTTTLAPDAPKGQPRQPATDTRPAALALLRHALAAVQALASANGSAALRAVHGAAALAAVRALEALFPPPHASPARPAAPGGPTEAREGDGDGLPFSHPQSRHARTAPAPTSTPGGAPGARSAGSGAEGAAHIATSGDARIAKLARKDALWYLCSVMHCAIPGLAAGQVDQAPDVMLHAAVCTALAGLIRRVGVRPAAMNTGGGNGSGGAEEHMDGNGRVTGETCRGPVGNGAVEREMLLAVAEKLWLAQG